VNPHPEQANDRTAVDLDECVAHLSRSAAFRSKRDIARLAARVDAAPTAVERWRENGARILIGDDTAAIPDGAGYLLLAAEGILPALLERDPYFAGWCSVMVNVSDVAAMGGHPLAVLDVYFHAGASDLEAVVTGIREACATYRVPLVGGHTSRSDTGPHALAVAILGRAEQLLTSFDAHEGDDVLVAVDLRGRYHGDFPFWNATGGRSAQDLRDDLALFGALAASGDVSACKDVSNVGFAGTLLMLLEASGVGATLDLERLPRPAGIDMARWLLTFPSYGFVLTAAPDRAGRALACFRERGIACERVGRIDRSLQLRLVAGSRDALLWDLARQPFTGFGPRRPS
jgi:AIR synthase-related protein